jgi:hypothetical protein
MAWNADMLAVYPLLGRSFELNGAVDPYELFVVRVSSYDSRAKKYRCVRKSTHEWVLRSAAELLTDWHEVFPAESTTPGP